MKYSAPRGTRDLLPAELSSWQIITHKILQLLENYGYSEIKTPIFEKTDLFIRGIGKLTDIVSKEMYTFEDKKGRSLTLRPEGTAPVVRAYLENNLARNGMQKLYYQGPMFRYERPQSGRYRQFHQIGVEVIGTQAAAIDAECIYLSAKICKEVGIKNVSVAINSVGCAVCRPVIREQFKSFIVSSLKNLCSDCQDRYEKNPLRILDCKREKCRTYFAGLPSPMDVLCQECADHYTTVIEYLDSSGLKYVMDPYLVRGLDYYTKTAFEIRSDSLGAQNAICGGGRYDELVQELGGAKTPAFGFAIGLERLTMVVEQQSGLPENNNYPLIYFVSMGELARRKVFSIRNNLCAQGIRAELDFENRSFKAQFKKANDLNVAYVCIIGEDEMESGTCQLKNMVTGEQEEIDCKGIEERLKSLVVQV